MKNIISKLAIVAVAATLSSNAIAAKDATKDAAKNQCSHLYVGKAVQFFYERQVGDAWLGYKMQKEYDGRGIVVGIGKGVATIKVTNSIRAFPNGHHELSCSELF